MTTAATRTAAAIAAKLTLDRTEYNKGLSQAKTDTKAFAKEGSSGLKGLGSAFQAVTGFSLGMAGAAAAAGVAIQKTAQFLRECEAAANEANIVTAKQAQILKATGYAAGLTASQLQEMATQQSRLTGIDDEAIANAQSLMLTFRKIGGETFPRAMQAALDLQTTFGSLDAAALQLGKALNDPVSGIAALARSGVTFSEEQKTMIAKFVEMGDVASAQAIILEEVERQVGGTAAAMEAASNGSDRLKVSTENLKEAIGLSLTDVTRKWNDFWTTQNERITYGIEKQTEYKEAVEALAESKGWSALKEFMIIRLYNYGVISKEVVAQALLNKTNEEYLEQQKMLEGAQSAVNDKFAEATEEIGKANQAMLSMASSLTSAEETYSKKSESLLKERIELATEKALRLKQGYSETGTVIRELDEKLAANATAAAENAAAHELATRKIILGYIEQQMQLDGPLSEAETEFLLQKGIEWGIYSETAVAEMRKINEEWNNEQWRNHVASLTIEMQEKWVGMSAPENFHGLTDYQKREIQQGIDLNGNGYIGRAFGGSTVAGGIYEVTEGGRPELLSSGGKNYLLMGSQGGYVTPASDGDGQLGGNLIAYAPINVQTNRASVAEILQDLKL